MPWVGNQYIFPRAAPAYATWPAPPAPPTLPPVIPQRWRRPEPIDGGDGAGMPGPGMPGPGLGPTAPGPAAPDPNLGFTSYAPAMSLFGSGLAGPAGMLGFGLLGAYTDVARAEEALSETYGQAPPGYGRVGYDPDLSTFGAFLNAVTPFGIFGKNAEQQLMDEMAHLAVVDLENPYAYQAEITPGKAWGAYETAPPVGSFDPFSPGGWSTGGGSYGGYGAPGSSDIGGEGPSGGEAGGAGAGGAGAGDKIACTMMNHLYGFGSFRNAVWMRYARDHMPEPEWELGYHKVYGPLVKMMPTHPWVRKFMRWFARTRTATLRRELRGKRPTFMQAVRRGVSRPIVYAVGWLVKRGFIKPADKASIKKEIENANIRF
jgi:hypothetical protein